MSDTQLLARITSEAGMMGVKPVIQGTRLTAACLLFARQKRVS